MPVSTYTYKKGTIGGKEVSYYLDEDGKPADIRVGDEFRVFKNLEDLKAYRDGIDSSYASIGESKAALDELFATDDFSEGE